MLNASDANDIRYDGRPSSPDIIFMEGEACDKKNRYIPEVLYSIHRKGNLYRGEPLSMTRALYEFGYIQYKMKYIYDGYEDT